MTELCCCMMGQNIGGRLSSADRTPITGWRGRGPKRSPDTKVKFVGERSGSVHREASESEDGQASGDSSTRGGEAGGQ